LADLRGRVLRSRFGNRIASSATTAAP